MSNNKSTILVIDEIFKTDDIGSRKITIEELFLKIIKKSEYEGTIPSKTL